MGYRILYSSILVDQLGGVCGFLLGGAGQLFLKIAFPLLFGRIMVNHGENKYEVTMNCQPNYHEERKMLYNKHEKGYMFTIQLNIKD